MKNIEIKTTKDGSHTIYVPILDEHYHSKFGAIEESRHIFINNGFNKINKTCINIFELGFGTGLNVLLTLLESIKNKKKVYYTSVEYHPLECSTISKLNYTDKYNHDIRNLYTKIHKMPWNNKNVITENFLLQKINTDIRTFDSSEKYDIIYFDAFAPDVQPELWSVDIFSKMRKLLYSTGILVTYSTKGTVKRNLIDAGFSITKFKGPPGGKRENLRAEYRKNE